MILFNQAAIHLYYNEFGELMAILRDADNSGRGYNYFSPLMMRYCYRNMKCYSAAALQELNYSQMDRS
jgi:hypothetical protein